MNEPLVSVCIPTYNGEKYIREALDSISRQTYSNIELIVSDDKSTDKSLQIVNDVTKDWNVPVYIYNHIPSGIGANWNNCVKHARGKYIKFLFQDDLIYPNCISELVAVAEKDEGIGMVFCERDLLTDSKADNEWIKSISDLSNNWKELNEIQDGKNLLNQQTFLDFPTNKIGEPSIVLIKKKCFDVSGYFSEQLKQTLDCEYWYRLMKDFKIGFVNKSLAAFRIHVEQASQVNKSFSLHNEYYLYYRLMKRNLYSYLSQRSKRKIWYRLIRHFVLKYFKDS